MEEHLLGQPPGRSPDPGARPVENQGGLGRGEGERFDGTGSALFGISLILVMYGFTRLPGTFGTALLLAGLAGLALSSGWKRGSSIRSLTCGCSPGTACSPSPNLGRADQLQRHLGRGFLLSL